MAKEYLSHEELQHIEHANKVLNEHLEILAAVRSIGDETFIDVLRSLKAYLVEFRAIQHDMGVTIKSIIESSRQMSLATNNTQNILSYCAAVDKLNSILDDKLIEKLRRITNENV